MNIYKNKLTSYVILLVLSLAFVLIAFFSSYIIILLLGAANLGGVILHLILGLLIGFPITWLFSLKSYKFLENKWNLIKLNSLIILILTGVISSLTFTYPIVFNIRIRFEQYAAKNKQKEFDKNITLSLFDEEFVEVNNTVGDKKNNLAYAGNKPYKYVYQITILVENHSKITYPVTSYSFNLVEKFNLSQYPPPDVRDWGNFQVNPGKNLMKGSHPISGSFDIHKAEKNSFRINSDSASKEFAIQSKLTNWDEIFAEQKLFYQKYADPNNPFHTWKPKRE